MSDSRFDSSNTRAALLDSLPSTTSLHGAPPQMRFMHLPGTHGKALRPDVALVTGMRGAGKSFWWAALQDPGLRRLIQEIAPQHEIGDAEIRTGFGETPNPSAYPDRDTLAALLAAGHSARLIWKSVLVHHLAPAGHQLRVGDDARWIQQQVEIVKQQPEGVASLLSEMDRTYHAHGRYWILLMDALDRTATDWPTVRTLIRGLLELALELRPYRRLRVKCFLRVDQIEDPRVSNFPDASKLLSERVELSWNTKDLYTLLFQHLCNAQGETGAGFRSELNSRFSLPHCIVRTIDNQSVWLPPDALRQDEAKQREVLHGITGPWMGRDAKRGYAYAWIPNHLADGRGDVSPRTLLAALRTAVDDSLENHPNHEWAVHFESIKRGVQTASKIRVDELNEDYPWVNSLMRPLAGVVLPCSFNIIEDIWREQRTLEELQATPSGDRLPPAGLNEGAPGVRRDLEQLNIFQRLTDGRVNIPDVFRVAFGMGRKGGVKPLRAGSSR
jgi:hypothetical protein